MTAQEFFTKEWRSNYRVAYFKVTGWENGKPTDIVDIKEAVMLEICLIPCDTYVDELNDSDKRQNTLLTIPAGAKIVRVRAGDFWPMIPNMGSFSDYEKYKAQRDENQDHIEYMKD